MKNICPECFELIDPATGECNPCANKVADSLFILATGDRNWNDHVTMLRAFEFWKPCHLIQGEAKGADTMAKRICQTHNREIQGIAAVDQAWGHCGITEVQAEWDRYGKAAGPKRNALMLEMLQKYTVKQGRTGLVLAFHHDLHQSKGTRNMVKQSLAAGERVRIYTGHNDRPEGQIVGRL